MEDQGLAELFETGQETGQETEQAAEASEVTSEPEGRELPDAPPAEPKQDKTEKTAPEVHGLRQALTEERTRRQQYEQQLRQALAHLQSQQTQPTAQPQQPAFDENPQAYIDHQAKTAQQKLQEHERHLQALYQQQQQQEQLRQASQRISNSEAEFVKSHDDYYQAVEFLRQMETRKLKSFGVPEEHIPGQVGQALFNAAATAMAQGRNPAEVAYNIANVYGWDQAKKLAQIARGQQNGKGPGSTGVVKDRQEYDEEVSEFEQLLAEVN